MFELGTRTFRRGPNKAESQAAAIHIASRAAASSAKLTRVKMSILRLVSTA